MGATKRRSEPITSIGEYRVYTVHHPPPGRALGQRVAVAGPGHRVGQHQLDLLPDALAVLLQRPGPARFLPRPFLPAPFCPHGRLAAPVRPLEDVDVRGAPQHGVLPDDELEPPGPRVDEAGPVRLQVEVVAVVGAEAVRAAAEWATLQRGTRTRYMYDRKRELFTIPTNIGTIRATPAATPP